VTGVGRSKFDWMRDPVTTIPWSELSLAVAAGGLACAASAGGGVLASCAKAGPKPTAPVAIATAKVETRTLLMETDMVCSLSLRIALSLVRSRTLG
jgi:hypothetical protein